MRISDWSSDVCSSDLPDHLFCERPHGLVLGFRQSLFTSRDVDLPSGVCDVCNLGIVWMRPIMSHRNSAHCEKRGGAAKGEFPDHFCVSLVLDSPAHWMPCKNCGYRNSSPQTTQAQRRARLTHNAATTFEIGRATGRESVGQYE